MERVNTLIEKLQEQLNKKATAEKLLVTVQMLQAELASQLINVHPAKPGKVAVIMPVFPSVILEKQNDISAKANSQPASEEKIIEVLQVDEKEIEEELEEIKKNAEAKNKMSSKAKPALLFDPVEDVPTLAHQTPPVPVSKEINDTASERSESINEKLRAGKTELSEKLSEGPIRDLKRGIGVNDRVLFINELFRGDEAMYERSIKTINNFSILAEAEYWIRRELKVKIGWTDSDPVVKQFDQLVRRRFF